MSEPNKYREWILETIDSLRSRKARPDLERICRMVRRRHGSDPDRTRTELEKLIQEQTVLKVSYKGSISYRNAAKVQRKSRKKSEFTAAGSSSAEAVRERTKHDHLNNNGDSAHSFTDQEEGEEDSEPSPDPNTQTPASCADKKLKPASSSPSSGNGCLSCGATTGCAVGSGCKEEKASALRDKGLGQQGAGDCPSPGLSHKTNAHDGGDASRLTPSKADAVLGEKELSGDDTHNKTCSGSVNNLPQQQRLKPASQPLKPKLRVGAGGTKTAGNHANSDLGDRLVASVRSLSERSIRGGSSAATRGHMKPLGLKEILGYLSSQERLSEEKLTRGKVKVVMEREVARGRLRRTRCGNITLPLRRMVVEEPTAERLIKSALQDKHTVKKPPSPSLQEHEPMEAASEEEDREEEEEEVEEEDPRSSDEEGGLSPVAMTTDPELIEKTTEEAEIQAALKQESLHQQQHSAKEMCGLDSLTRTPRPPVQGASLSQCNNTHSEEKAAVPDRQHMEAKNQMQHDRINHTPSAFNSSESKTEVGVSSCLLTPTASPRDSGMCEERGMNGGVSSGGFMKSEGASGSPVDWTVSDVVSYFTAAGFPEQATAFRTQEIDGKSLLLMQRNDVLTGLSIRLGPALKIYERHVKVLQKTHFEDDDC
ncbi:sterile alpha motif domain-containing protein 1 isoform X2 [Centropristis striata]|uniref:sterile alpha motif domain-containing protein 1 isoform X2 n=1 Tax=Centropristis striata TaxID=184440 RepID=UPI0027DF063B|nr:sterile alpha motif domain-containing protein 1 isoform X2 [Centropristis striata]